MVAHGSHHSPAGAKVPSVQGRYQNLPSLPRFGCRAVEYADAAPPENCRRPPSHGIVSATIAVDAAYLPASFARSASGAGFRARASRRGYGTGDHYRQNVWHGSSFRAKPIDRSQALPFISAQRGWAHPYLGRGYRRGRKPVGKFPQRMGARLECLRTALRQQPGL